MYIQSWSLSGDCPVLPDLDIDPLVHLILSGHDEALYGAEEATCRPPGGPGPHAEGSQELERFFACDWTQRLSSKLWERDQMYHVRSCDPCIM